MFINEEVVLTLFYNHKEAQASARVSNTPLHKLQVCEVLLSVGIKESFGVIMWIREDLVHLLIKVPSLVGHLHRKTMAVHRIIDSSSGDLSF